MKSEIFQVVDDNNNSYAYFFSEEGAKEFLESKENTYANKVKPLTVKGKMPHDKEIERLSQAIRDIYLACQHGTKGLDKNWLGWNGLNDIINP